MNKRLHPSVKHAYRVNEACWALGIGRTKLYELVKAGELRLIKIAGRTLVPRSELERLTRLD
jgi:excisionase family DNA binding protein